MIVSESPGEEEDDAGKLLVGNSSKELARVVSSAGISLHHDCSLTNALICYPDGKAPERAVEYCRPNLIETVKKERPKVIILLGLAAVESLIPYIWTASESVGGMEQWVGWTIPSQKLNAWVCPTYHPAYLLRMKSKLLDRTFARNIKAAVRLEATERPWSDASTMPSESAVQLLYSSKEITKALTYFSETGHPVAFDYETNCLKPDNSYAEIVCVGLSNGYKTVAFMLTDIVKPFVKQFLLSPVEKIGHHTKFEDCWTYRIFGIWPKKVKWCGMNNAHILDERPGITGLKFQAFVRFGQPDYSSHIKPYLEGEGSYGKNRIHDAPQKELLTYCGMDALLEYMEYEHQSKELMRKLR